MASLADYVQQQFQKQDARRAAGQEEESSPRQTVNMSIRHASWFINEEGLVNFNAAPGVHVYLIETDDPAWPVAVRMCKTDASRRYDEATALQVGRGKWLTSQAGREYLFCLYENFFMNIYFYEPGQRKENGPVAYSYIQAKPALPKPGNSTATASSSKIQGLLLQGTAATPGKIVTVTPATKEVYAGVMLDEHGQPVM